MVCKLDIGMSLSLDSNELRDKLKACLTNFFFQVDTQVLQGATVSTKKDRKPFAEPFRFEIRFDPRFQNCFLSETEVSYDFSDQKLERIV